MVIVSDLNDKKSKSNINFKFFAILDLFSWAKIRKFKSFRFQNECKYHIDTNIYTDKMHIIT